MKKGDFGQREIKMGVLGGFGGDLWGFWGAFVGVLGGKMKRDDGGLGYEMMGDLGELMGGLG